MRSVKAGERVPNMFIETLKGGLLASVISIALIVLYALALWKEVLPASSMPIANAVIKVISAAAAALERQTEELQRSVQKFRLTA